MTGELEAYKERQRAMWGLGDYSLSARRLEGAATDLVAACAVRPGQEVLDIAAGTGNVALAAAAAGARVTAADLAPRLVALGRERTEAAGVEVAWSEADAEALPFADQSFDAALSVFGLVFAPRPEVAIAEAFRVVRPGGTIGLTTWVPGGAAARFGATVGAHMGGGEDGPPPPNQWGDEAIARERLAPHTDRVVFERGTVRYAFPSAATAREESEETQGMLLMARAALAPERFAALMDDLEDLMRELSVATDGSIAYDAEYLRIVAQRPG